MSYQRSKLKGFTLPNIESFHITRNPPSSIHTRKKERVDSSDVVWMNEDDPTRHNESIAKYARGTNVMSDYSYNNYGGGSTNSSMANVQASLPYKIGVVRPPMYSMEDRLPLSRQPRPETSGYTNPGSSLTSRFAPNLEESSDKKKTNFSLKKSLLFSARPTAVYKLEFPTEVFTRNAITDRLEVRASSIAEMPYKHDMYVDRSNPFEASRDPLRAQKLTNPNNPLSIESRNEEINIDNYIKKILVGKIDPNFHIVIYDSNNRNYSEVAGSIKDKLNIAVQSSIGAPLQFMNEDGQKIKLKEYRWKIVQSAIGGDSLVLNVVNNPDLHLNKNIPLYSMGSAVSGISTVDNERMNENEINLRSKLLTSAGPSISKPYGSGRNEAVFDSERNILLRRQGNYGSFSNFGTIPQLANHRLPDLPVEKSEMQNQTREMGDRFGQW